MEAVGLKAGPPAAEFWRGRRVLLTGHTGFKGAWLSIWLDRLGANVTGVSLAPRTTPSLFEQAGVADQLHNHICDIRDPEALPRIVRDSRPEIVFHLAAQSLVRAGYRDPIGTFATNVQGTAHLLEAVRAADGVRVVIAATTDKVYENLEQGVPFRETDRLGGHDPYSASKAAAELVIACYRQSFLVTRGVAVASARAGNAIGGGDWSEDRLIPDAVRAWAGAHELHVRRPEAVRPWQHVLEPLAAYIRLAELLWVDGTLAGAYNFGPDLSDTATVRQVVTIAQAAYGCGSVSWGSGEEGVLEAGHLSLEIAKARSTLQFEPRWTLERALQRTMAWYRAARAGTPARDLCSADIAEYEAALSR